MARYHDEEWGVPVHDDRRLFEFLILEGAQAGLSWETVLRKRERYREVFDGFDASKIAQYDARKVRALLADPGIIRNRLKISSTISNAQAFLEVQREFGSFDAYIWQFTGGKTLRHARRGSKRRARANRGIRRHEQGSEEARLPFRRLNHLLRVHAGHRHGERSSPHAVSAGRKCVERSPVAQASACGV